MAEKGSILRAPWTSEQVDALNRFQYESGIHPYTCPDGQVLAASHSGWYCMDSTCRYTQDWALAFAADPDVWGPASRNWHCDPECEPCAARRYEKRVNTPASDETAEAIRRRLQFGERPRRRVTRRPPVPECTPDCTEQHTCEEGCLALKEPDNSEAVALARHIANFPVSTVQAAFRFLGMSLSFDLVENETRGAVDPGK